MITSTSSLRGHMVSLTMSVFAVLSVGFVGLASAIPFYPYQNYPGPAPSAFGVTGAALPNGRLVLWNGDEIYVQQAVNADRFARVSSGYIGDPGFVAVAPDGHTLVLGAGFGGNLYRFDVNAPDNYSSTHLIASVPGHFSGVFLTSTLLLLDVGRLDFTGSELHILDLSGAKSLPQPVVRKSGKYFLPKSMVIDKPPFAYSSSVAVDITNNLVYAMDANTRELRFFSRTALINAFTSNTTLDWAADGTLVGTVGQFYSGGVAGITPAGHLIIGGSAGFMQPGGIQIVDPNLSNPSAATVVSTEDPLGTQPYYSVIYNPYTDVITADAFGIVFSSAPFAQLPAVTPAGVATLVGTLCCAGAIYLRRRRRAVRILRG